MIDNIIIIIYFIIYCLIGLMVNGLTNDKDHAFSVTLMLGWPVITVLAIISCVIVDFTNIGKGLINLFKK